MLTLKQKQYNTKATLTMTGQPKIKLIMEIVFKIDLQIPMI